MTKISRIKQAGKQDSMIGHWAVGLVQEKQIIYDDARMISGENYGIAIFNQCVLGVGFSCFDLC